MYGNKAYIALLPYNHYERGERNLEILLTVLKYDDVISRFQSVAIDKFALQVTQSFETFTNIALFLFETKNACLG